MKIAIIGGGAAGLMAANKLHQNHEVTIFEKTSSVGRKILSSGGGKANIWNKNVSPEYYNDKNFMGSFLTANQPQNLFNEFKMLGLVMKTDEEGRVYPISESSQSVLNVLLKNIKDVEIKLNTPVKSIAYCDNAWIINDNPNYKYDVVIAASGSNAGNIARNQAYTYDYLLKYNIKMNELRPSLCGFKTNINLKEISGVRAKALCKLLSNGKLIYEEFGEVNFKDDGISGIVILNLSSKYALLDKSKKSLVVIDLIPSLSENELSAYFEKEKDLSGLIHPKLAEFFKSNPKNAKNMNIPIVSTYDFEFAQVTHGGVLLSEIDSNLSYIKNKNLYFVGEVLDIDGMCGGFNLFFAFSSAISVARKINKLWNIR